MLIVGIERQGIVHKVHYGKVSELNILYRSGKYSEAPDCGIIADALDCHVKIVRAVVLYLKSLCRRRNMVEVGEFYRSDDSECDRSRVLALHICIEDCLPTHALGCRTLLCVGDDVALYRLGIVGVDVDNARAIFQCSIVLVRAYAVAHALMSEAGSVVCHGCEQTALGSFILLFAAVNNRNNHKLICSGRESNHIGTTVRAIVAHKLIVNLSPVGCTACLVKDVVSRGILKRLPRNVATLEPALRLDNLDSRIYVKAE